MSSGHRATQGSGSLCACGHVMSMCHRVNAGRYCPPTQGEREALELLSDLAMEGRIIGLGDPAAEVNDQTGVLGRVRATLERLLIP